MKRFSALRLWEIVGPFLIYAILYNCLYLFLLRIRDVLILRGDAFALTLLAYEAQSRLCIIGICVLVLLVVFRAQGMADVRALQYGAAPPSMTLLIAVLFCAFSHALSMNLLLHVTGIAGSAAQPGAETVATGVSLPLEIALYGILTPLLEELVFRGIVSYRAAAAFGKWKGILTAAVLFAVIHWNVPQILYSLTAGLLMGYLYLTFRRFELPYLFHTVSNLTALIVVPQLLQGTASNKGVWMTEGFLVLMFSMHFFHDKAGRTKA